MKKYLFVIILSLISFLVQAQVNVTIIGSVKDASNGEDLIGATIYVEQLKTGTATNAFGFYSINMKPDLYTFRVSYLGYQTKQFTIPVDRQLTYNIRLEPSTEQLGEILISTEAINQNIIGVEMGAFKLDPKTIKSIPVLFGEQDLLKTIQLMPGVSSAGEGGSGFYVRGGQVDQNLILLDDAPVYNPSHLLGFFSVFNSDAINSAKLYKGGVPAQFGGRASSVLDITMRDGN